MPALIRLLRPHQYMKNVLVFAAPGAAGRLDETSVIARGILAFVLFCAVSSIGYVRNDMLDAEADRLHPEKKFRPIAAGEVSESQATWLLFALAIPTIALSPLLGWGFTAVIVGYAATTLSYSGYLKRVPWIELLAVSLGFLLRAAAGGAATSTRVTVWFLLVVTAGALLVITGKRLGEFLALGPNTASRSVLSHYRLMHLRFVAGLAAALAAGGYAAWAVAESMNQVIERGNSTLLRLTAIPFGAAIGRYLVLSWNGHGETPESLMLQDRLMIAAGATWTAIYALGRYS